MILEDTYIYIETGDFIKAKSFGCSGTRIGEMVFNTSLSGYQEIITDPSYAGQFILFTMPEIGVVGSNYDDMESRDIFASGVIIKNLTSNYSNSRAKESLSSFLKKHKSFGICNIDTRYLTKILRDFGSKMMIASTKIKEKMTLKNTLLKQPRVEEINYVKLVSTKKSYFHTKGAWNSDNFSYNTKIIKEKNRKKVLVIDFGVKKNILNELREQSLEVEVVPHNFDESKIIKQHKDGLINGVVLTNGPGNPVLLKDEIEKIKKIAIIKIPILAICLGHQLLAIANRYNIDKLKFGHHGSNHPIKRLHSKHVEITSQNHIYNVSKESLDKNALNNIYENLFDKTVCGIVYEDYPIISLQYHPEASPGPQDSKYVFKEFKKLISRY